MATNTSVSYKVSRSTERRTLSFAQFASVALAMLLLASAASAQFATAYTVDGDAASTNAGYSVAGLGDINGDLRSDFVVGMPDADISAANSGSARVYSGLDGSTIFTFNGDAAADGLGIAVANAGDVNNDGINDIIVGAHMNDTTGADAGMARVYSGATGAVLHTVNGLTAGDMFGSSVGGAGDVNNDGFDDFIVGAALSAPNGAGSGTSTIFSGADASVLYTLVGDSAGDSCGHAVAGAGDVNDDGFDDVILGIPGNDDNGIDSGSVRIVSGADGTTLFERDGDNAGDNLGWSVAGAGNIDEDDFDDFMAGTLGAVYMRVYSGIDASTIFTPTGTAGAAFGEAVDSAGDVNADGVDDFIVGDWSDDTNGANAGAAFIYSGATGLLLDSKFGDSAGDQFGWSVAGAGDTNFDAFGDVVVGANSDDNNGAGSGSARVFTAPFVPVLVYKSILAESRLRLRWVPDLGDPNSLTGVITCGNATPGAFGRFGLSLAPANSILFGFPLLLAIDPTNLLDSGNFGYGLVGAVSVPNVSRQNPFLAGLFVFIQFFESAPFPASSNGLAMLVSP